MTRSIAGVICLVAALPASAQPRLFLRENLQVGQRYHVRSRVDISGAMTVPPANKNSKEVQLAISGTSAIDYHERVLVLDRGEVTRTIRQYERLSFDRTLGDQEQYNKLRPEIRKLIILRSKQAEAPFSPDGPLTWGEIDMVRTDVFAPALTGLLPDAVVQIGQRWQARQATIQELTDLERIEEGSLTCTLESESTLGGRRLARVAITGSVRGIGEDGPARHELDGFCFFDLSANMISYLSLRGVHHMINAEGKALGKIEGTFVMTREPASGNVLDDQAIRGIALDPTDDNTLMLFENAEIGVRLTHSRRWRIASITAKQITLDEPQGSGVLITLEALDKLPTTKEYLQEAQSTLEQQKASIRSLAPPRKLDGAAGIDNFALSADVGKQAVYLDYYLVRQNNGGVLIAARLVGGQRQVLQNEITRTVRSLQLLKRQ